MATTSLTDIAADIRKHSPGVLPESLVFDRGITPQFRMSVDRVLYPLSDEIIEAVLRDAMVRDVGLARDADSWCSMNQRGAHRDFPDADYGGPTQSAHAAWREAKGLSEAPT